MSDVARAQYAPLTHTPLTHCSAEFAIAVVVVVVEFVAEHVNTATDYNTSVISTLQQQQQQQSGFPCDAFYYLQS